MTRSDAADFLTSNNQWIWKFALSLLVRLSCFDPRSHADDVTQDVLVRLLQSWQSLRSPKAALKTIIVNAAHSHLKVCRQETSEEIPETPDPVSADPEKLCEASKFLMTVFSHLNETDRQIFIYSYFQGYTFEEISAFLGIPSATIRSRHCRALMKLKEVLGEPIDQ